MVNQNKDKSPTSVSQGNVSGQEAPYSPEMLTKYLEVQQQEVQLRTEEFAIHAQQEETNKSIAEQSIAANLQDRDNERAHVERKTKIILKGVIILVVVVVLFVAYALYSGKDAIVMKIIEVVAIFAAGFAGGYGLKASKRAEEQSQNLKG